MGNNDDKDYMVLYESNDNKSYLIDARTVVNIHFSKNGFPPTIEIEGGKFLYLSEGTDWRQFMNEVKSKKDLHRERCLSFLRIKGFN